MTATEETIKLVKESIISCSRRSDVPAFLMDWVIENMKNGYVDVPNPYNPSFGTSRVSLNPEDVMAFAWWSKNYAEWIKTYKSNEELFNSYKAHYFNFTINSPSPLERGVNVSLEDRFDQVKWLVEKFGDIAVTFRTDPIIKYRNRLTDEIAINIDKFEYIVEKLSSIGIKSVTFSFAHLYPQTIKRMESRKFEPIDISYNEKIEITRQLKVICDSYGMKMKTCCQPVLLGLEGMYQSHCIDGDIIEELVGEEINKPRDKGQRKACRCVKSRDIGGYYGIFRCRHNCAYCYANTSDL